MVENLLDEIAIVALKEFLRGDALEYCSKSAAKVGQTTAELLAEASYDIARAMIAEREKK